MTYSLNRTSCVLLSSHAGDVSINPNSLNGGALTSCIGHEILQRDRLPVVTIRVLDEPCTSGVVTSPDQHCKNVLRNLLCKESSYNIYWRDSTYTSTHLWYAYPLQSATKASFPHLSLAASASSTNRSSRFRTARRPASMSRDRSFPAHPTTLQYILLRGY